MVFRTLQQEKLSIKKYQVEGEIEEGFANVFTDITRLRAQMDLLMNNTILNHQRRTTLNNIAQRNLGFNILLNSKPDFKFSLGTLKDNLLEFVLPILIIIGCLLEWVLAIFYMINDNVVQYNLKERKFFRFFRLCIIFQFLFVITSIIIVLIKGKKAKRDDKLLTPKSYLLFARILEKFKVLYFDSQWIARVYLVIGEIVLNLLFTLLVINILPQAALQFLLKFVSQNDYFDYFQILKILDIMLQIRDNLIILDF